MHIWLAKLIRQFFIMIDTIVYNGIAEVYRLLIDISRTSVLSQSSIESIGDRIYQLLAVFMTFKVIFSLIMYVVNPDDFSDKSKGVSKLGVNVIITLSLLILTPYAFRYAYQLQNIVLEDNSLGVLVFGDTDDDDLDSDFSVFSSGGESIAFYAMRPFFVPNSTMPALKNCVVLMKNGKFNQECSGADLDNPEIYDGKHTDSLAGLVSDVKNSKANYDYTDVANYVYGVENESLGLMFRPEIALGVVENGGQKNFVIDYKFMFSTPIGIIIVLLLISFCMDVALRSIKLTFLQLIAPIPIISYLDPKSGKDGMFKKWYQLCFKTYISLFVRLLALYFAIFIISKIDKMSDVLDGSYQSSTLVKVFVIIGCLMFAKQLPKMLEGLGIKLDGDGKFTLNPLKKFGNEALGGKKILGFGAAAGAAGLAGATNFASRMFHPNSWKNDKGKFSFSKGVSSMLRAPGSAVAGAFSAFRRGGQKAMKEESMGKIFSDSYGEAMFAKKQREDLNRKGSTFGGRLAADFNRLTGNYTAAQTDSITYGTLKAEHDAEMAKIKSDKEATARKKYLAQDRYARQEKYMSAINSKIEKQKAVKEAQASVDSLKSSGRYYATEGALNSHGKLMQAEIDKKSSRFTSEETKVSRNIESTRATLSQMKANKNYYERDKDGKIVRDAAGHEVLTREAQEEERRLSEYTRQYDEMRTAHADELQRDQDALNNDTSARYRAGELTEEGQAAKERLDSTSASEYQRLVSEDAEIQEVIRNIEALNRTLPEGERIVYTNPDGTFNKQAMYDAQTAIGKINQEYAAQEESYEVREKEEIDRFNAEVTRLGVDPDSDTVRAHKADDVAHDVKTKEAPGTAMSAREVDRSTYSRYANEFAFDGPSGPGGGGPHGPGPGPGPGA